MTHTNGPLNISAVRRTMDGQRWLRILSEADGFERAYVPFGDRTTEEYVQCMSDAKLYAAAPDLLNALKAVLPMLEAVRMQVGFGKTQEKRIEVAKAAIAKATA